MGSKIILLVIVSTINGCSVGPDYRKPNIPSPEHWQAEVDAADGVKSVHPAVFKNWWISFNDKYLSRLMAKALAGNLDLKIAITLIDQARAERRSTRGELFPTVNLTTGAQKQKNPFPGFAPGISFNMFELGFDALWEIDLFGRVQRRLEASSAELEGAAELYQQALVTLTAELARSYVEYRSIQNLQRITLANLSAQQHTLKLTEKLNLEGVSTWHDVVRARAQSETTQAQIPVLEGKRIAAARGMEVLTGGSPGSLNAELNSFEAVPAALGLNILTTPAETLRQRPDVQIAERRLAAATAMQGAAMAELYPKISLSAFLGLRNTDVESLFKSAAFSYGTFANLVQPLLNFGRIRAGIDLADAKQKEAYLAYEKSVLEALQETETALSKYLTETQRLNMLNRSATDLRESVRLSQLRFQEGVISFLDVLDAQRALYAAEIDLARSEGEASKNLIAVYKALGGGANSMTAPIKLSKEP